MKLLLKGAFKYVFHIQMHEHVQKNISSIKCTKHHAATNFDRKTEDLLQKSSKMNPTVRFHTFC